MLESKTKIVTVKISGSNENIQRFRELLNRLKEYQILSTSRVFPNQNMPGTFHVFVDLLSQATLEVQQE